MTGYFFATGGQDRWGLAQMFHMADIATGLLCGMRRYGFALHWQGMRAIRNARKGSRTPNRFAMYGQGISLKLVEYTLNRHGEHFGKAVKWRAVNL